MSLHDIVNKERLRIQTEGLIAHLEFIHKDIEPFQLGGKIKVKERPFIKEVLDDRTNNLLG